MSLEINQLTKTYGSVHAVDGITFAAHKGEVLGFLGPNGAGKSTTMKIATCYLPPTLGTAVVNGFDVNTHPLEARRQVGYLPEHNPLYLDMYITEYLEFSGKSYGLRRKELSAAVDRVIGMTGLGNERHKKIASLSKGYRQRVGLAQALVHNPPVLIMDEPTTGLDPNQIVEIRALIKEVGREKTVVLSTHILAEVQAICNRYVIINKGKIVADGSTAPNSQRSLTFLLEVEGAAPEAAALAALTGVAHVEQTAPRVFEIELTQEREGRNSIIQYCAQHQIDLARFARIENNLEAIFKNATSQ